MALPRKGTRRIVVDGVAYQWRGTDVGLTVQRAGGPGGVLTVRISRDWPQPPLMPGEVADHIRRAIREGWQPTIAGPAFALTAEPPARVMPSQFTPPTLPNNSAAWLISTDPFLMLAAIDAHSDARPTLLLTLALARPHWPSLPEETRAWLTLAEAVAEGRAERTPLSDDDRYGPAINALQTWAATLDPARALTVDLLYRMLDIQWKARQPRGVDPRVATPAAGLVRDLFGNPFVPVPELKQSAFNRTIRAIAETIYAEERFEDLPILADALEEAECADAAILEHLREPGPHLRGCWALDWVLDRDRRAPVD